MVDHSRSNQIIQAAYDRGDIKAIPVEQRKAMKPTRQQIQAFKSIYDRPLENGPVAPTYLQFRRTIRPALGSDCYMVEWCGMWLGIETDGYTHS